MIATDFDREGELIGSDALTCIREVNEEAPVSRARYSAITKEEITRAFTNLVELCLLYTSIVGYLSAFVLGVYVVWQMIYARHKTRNDEDIK